MGTVAELQTEWARLVIDSFVCAGVVDAVISPGSRSTPFVVAALQDEELRCTSALDERSAAYYALGQARSSLRPTLLLCTSGSAPANYYPAVIEASEAGVPLIVLSADRPPELHACGANQTTRQSELYGAHVRLFANLGEPREDLPSLRALRRLVAQAVDEASGVRPGAVHLNAQARKPLEPTPSTGALRARVESLMAEPLTVVHRARPLEPTLVEAVPPLLVDAIVQAFNRAERPVILCGPADVRSAMFVDSLATLSERAAAPVLAETTSQFRCWSQTRAIGAFDTIWRTEAGRASFRPDFVLQLGAAPISKGWELLSTDASIARFVVHPWEWADPSSDAEAIVQADIGSVLVALADADFQTENRDPSFIQRFREADVVAWRTVDAILDESGEALTEAGAVRATFDALPDPSALMLANSLPIRHAEAWAAPSKKLLLVHSQRGVSGIDGLVSGAAGVASVVDGPTTLLIGDVSFVHDINGLQLASRAPGPLVLVVLNNGGGRIFEQLPIGRDGEEAWLPFFTTPHEVNLGQAASAFGCGHVLARTGPELREALKQAYGTDGCTVVEALVPPTSAREQKVELHRRVEQALASEGA
jgi:2-succinyl-5-enolpyruvyl-6-hydroxy-3-cyclohexene-1-carboxylate synthase